MERTLRMLGIGALMATYVLTPPAGAIPADQVTVSPTSGAIGTAITITGTIDCPGQADGDPVLIGFEDYSQGVQTRTNLGMPPRAADGTFSFNSTVPSQLAQYTGPVDVTPGSYVVSAQCTYSDSTPNSVETPFTVIATSTTTAPTTTTTMPTTTMPTTTMPTTTAPTTTAPPTTAVPTTAAPVGFTPPANPPQGAAPISSSVPSTAVPGQSIPLSEGDFVPGEDVTIVLYSSPVILSTVQADAAGVVTTTVRIPPGTAVGQHTLVMFGSVVKSASVAVVAPVERTSLPRTGTNDSSGTLALAAVGSIVVGALTVAGSRRRLTKTTR